MSELVPTPRGSPAKPRLHGSPRWLLPAVIARDFREPSERWRILVEVPGDLHQDAPTLGRLAKIA
ncbi:MAG TPA: hypothetical protein VE913_03590, partial [Longimicrobium sp.]|nr:hypothetical protein [Longimicrobium sp.]